MSKQEPPALNGKCKVTIPGLEKIEKLDTRWNEMHYETWNPGYHLSAIYSKVNELTDAVNMLIQIKEDEVNR